LRRTFSGRGFRASTHSEARRSISMSAPTVLKPKADVPLPASCSRTATRPSKPFVKLQCCSKAEGSRVRGDGGADADLIRFDDAIRTKRWKSSFIGRRNGPADLGRIVQEHWPARSGQPRPGSRGQRVKWALLTILSKTSGRSRRIGRASWPWEVLLRGLHRRREDSRWRLQGRTSAVSYDSDGAP